jgi:hypothetical protein
MKIFDSITHLLLIQAKPGLPYNQENLAFAKFLISLPSFCQVFDNAQFFAKFSNLFNNCKKMNFHPIFSLYIFSMGSKLINSLISVKRNADFNCIQAYDIFISHPELLKQVKSQEKYKV